MTELALAAFQQWTLFTGVALAVGCVAWRLVVAPGASRRLGGDAAGALRSRERSVASFGLATALVLVGVWGLRLVVQVMGFRDPFAPLSEDVSFLLFETFWGTVWMAQGVVIPLLAFSFWRARAGDRPAEAEGVGTSTPLSRSSPAWSAATVLVLLLALTLSLSGHAVSSSPWRPLIVTADAVHTVAAGAWIGALGLILMAGPPAGEDAVHLDLYAAQLRSFSPMAVVAVTALLTMGVVLAWTHLNAFSDLWTMTYGRVLSAKIGLAGAVFGAGLWNWQRGLPALGTGEGARAIQRRASWEASLAVGVLLVTAVLVHSPKP